MISTLRTISTGNTSIHSLIGFLQNQELKQMYLEGFFMTRRVNASLTIVCFAFLKLLYIWLFSSFFLLDLVKDKVLKSALKRHFFHSKNYISLYWRSFFCILHKLSCNLTFCLTEFSKLVSLMTIMGPKRDKKYIDNAFLKFTLIVV